jgi:MOSC domain-containing protein YiiM
VPGGIAVNEALIGERWRIGADLLLEVSCPRIPCGTFQGWMGRRGWVKRFTQAALPADTLADLRDISSRVASRTS